MPNTFELIASSTVGAGGTSAIDFTSIPSTYTDLCVVYSLRSDRAGQSITDTLMQFNGDTGSNYSSRRLYGSGTAAASDNFGTLAYVGYAPASTATANTFGNSQVYIPNYAGSTTKSYSCDATQENNTTAAYQFLIAGLWNNTAAINRVRIFDANGTNYVQYSTAYLYGVKNA